MADTPHITITTCPNCGAYQKTVGDQDHMTWYCFVCQHNGTFAWTFQDLTEGATSGDQEG